MTPLVGSHIRPRARSDDISFGLKLGLLVCGMTDPFVRIDLLPGDVVFVFVAGDFTSANHLPQPMGRNFEVMRGLLQSGKAQQIKIFAPD